MTRKWYSVATLVLMASGTTACGDSGEIDGSTLHLIITNAIEDESCMDDGELLEFTPRELKELQSKLAQVVAVSTLP